MSLCKSQQPTGNLAAAPRCHGRAGATEPWARMGTGMGTGMDTGTGARPVLTAHGQTRAPGRSSASSLQVSVRSVQSIPQTSECNNSQEDEKCHKLFTHKRDEKGEGGEEESMRGRDT